MTFSTDELIAICKAFHVEPCDKKSTMEAKIKEAIRELKETPDQQDQQEQEAKKTPKTEDADIDDSSSSSSESDVEDMKEHRSILSKYPDVWVEAGILPYSLYERLPKYAKQLDKELARTSKDVSMILIPLTKLKERLTKNEQLEDAVSLVRHAELQITKLRKKKALKSAGLPQHLAEPKKYSIFGDDFDDRLNEISRSKEAIRSLNFQYQSNSSTRWKPRVGGRGSGENKRSSQQFKKPSYQGSTSTFHPKNPSQTPSSGRPPQNE